MEEAGEADQERLAGVEGVSRPLEVWADSRMMMPDGNAPRTSNIMKHPELAATFEAIAKDGKDGFYKGRIAQGMSEADKCFWRRS